MEDNSWAQTLITVTPEEDGYLREIMESSVISGHDDIQLELGTQNIVHRQSLQNITKDFIDPRELEKSEFKESQCQTYMKGVPKVEFRISYQDEATQTLYIGRNSLATMKNIVSVMNKKPIPKVKRSRLTQTIVSFEAEKTDDALMNALEEDITGKYQKSTGSVEQLIEEELVDESLDILNFIVERVVWISEPQPEAEIENKNVEVETILKYNHYLKRFVNEIETQTSLSLESKSSNSKLLDEYLATKKSVQICLEQCIDVGVYTKMMIDEFIDEIINKSCEIIRHPMKSEAIQTIASCRVDEDKDEDVLKKLRASVFVDTLESSIIVLPVIDDILEKVVNVVSSDAKDVTSFFINKLIDKVVGIGFKLNSIRRESETPPIEQKLFLRRKKLAQLIPKTKEFEDASTQTGLAGVPEIRKIKEINRVVCSVCPTESTCQWCSLGDQTEENSLREEMEKKPKKILRTQDILLAYKPCYMVVDSQDITPDMKPPCSSELPKLPKKKTKIDDFEEFESDITDESDSRGQTTNHAPQKSRRIDSASGGWSNIVDEAIAWTSEDSIDSQSQVSKKIPLKKELDMEKVKALQLLMKSFCTPTTCPGMPKELSSHTNMNQDDRPGTRKVKYAKGMNFCQAFVFSDSDE